MDKENEITITPLGTVSPYCKGNSNCPGFLISDGKQKIMLDCGNGVSRYLNMETDLNDLIIIISHLHRDHYGDLTSIAYASTLYKNLGYVNDKIKVYIPSGDKIKYDMSYIGEDGWGCSKTLDKPIIDYEYLNEVAKTNNLEIIDYNQSLKIKHGMFNISFSKNQHPITTHSVKIIDGLNTIVYSSDTGYNGNCLEKFAENADILICESSFLKGQIKNNDYHLFAHEAAKIAKYAKVKQLVLTHFWPEIEKERYVNEAKMIFENTIQAEEGKVLKLQRINK